MPGGTKWRRYMDHEEMQRKPKLPHSKKHTRPPSLYVQQGKQKKVALGIG